MLPARKTVSSHVKSLQNFAWGRHLQNFWIKITASRLSYGLGLHGEKKFNGNLWILWKIDIVKMTLFTLPSKTDNFKRRPKVLPWNWFKWRRKLVPKECCDYLSCPWDVCEATPGRSHWTSRHCCRNSSEKAATSLFVIIKKKRKGLEVTFCQHNFKCNVQENHF